MARIDSVKYKDRRGGSRSVSIGPMFGGMEQGQHYGTPNSGSIDTPWDHSDSNFSSSYNGRLEQPDSFQSTINTAKDRLTTISIGIDYSRYLTTEIKGLTFTADQSEYTGSNVGKVWRFGYVLKNNYEEGSIWWWASDVIGSVDMGPYGKEVTHRFNEETLSLLNSGFSFRGIRLLLSTEGHSAQSKDSRIKVGNFRFMYNHEEPDGNLVLPAYRPSSQRKRSDMIYYPGS